LINIFKQSADMIQLRSKKKNAISSQYSPSPRQITVAPQSNVQMASTEQITSLAYRFTVIFGDGRNN